MAWVLELESLEGPFQSNDSGGLLTVMHCFEKQVSRLGFFFILRCFSQYAQNKLKDHSQSCSSFVLFLCAPETEHAIHLKTTEWVYFYLNYQEQLSFEVEKQSCCSWFFLFICKANFILFSFFFFNVELWFGNRKSKNPFSQTECICQKSAELHYWEEEEWSL